MKVIIESPFAGNIKENIKYARACMKDSFDRGEYPFASHLLYTQDGILDDNIPEERERGIQAGFEWGKDVDIVAVYTDLGISNGMKYGIDYAENRGAKIEYRTIK